MASISAISIAFVCSAACKMRKWANHHQRKTISDKHRDVESMLQSKAILSIDFCSTLVDGVSGDSGGGRSVSVCISAMWVFHFCELVCFHFVATFLNKYIYIYIRLKTHTHIHIHTETNNAYRTKIKKSLLFDYNEQKFFSLLTFNVSECVCDL